MSKKKLNDNGIAGLLQDLDNETLENIDITTDDIGFKIAPLFGFEEKFLADIAPLLFSWFTLIILSSILMFTIPKEWGNPKEMRYGVMAGVIVVFLPQICGLGLLLCALWFIAVTLGWVFVSTYQWKYDVQPFRTGLWLGVGGLVGMFMGSWAMSIILA